MGWRYILINHSRKIIVETSLLNVWSMMSRLIEEEGWMKTDNVEMMFEDGHIEIIGKLVVNEGYKSHYNIRDFDYILD